MKNNLVLDAETPVGKYVLFPENFANSPCEMCGKCCNNDWVVEMSKDEFLRYRTFFDNSGLPGDADALFQEKQTENGVSYRLLPCKGRCVFLLEDNKCHIHTQYGPEAKSRACKNFPLSVNTYSPRGLHLRVSFTCPSILRSLLSDDEIIITRSTWENNFLCRGSINFLDNHAIAWEQFFLLKDSLASLFLNKPFLAEDTLLIAGAWIYELHHKLKEDSQEEYLRMSTKDFLWANKQNFFNVATEFRPNYSEYVSLITHIAYAIMQEEFVVFGNKGKDSLSIARLLEPGEVKNLFSEKIQNVYYKKYLKELPAFSHIIEKYLLHKVLSVEEFAKCGFVYGINHLSLCYTFLRLYLLSELIFRKDTLDSDDVLDAINFVELIFFHRQTADFFKSPQIINILSKPILPFLLIKL